MRRRAKRPETTKLYYSPFTNQGLRNLKRWLKIRENKRFCWRAANLLGSCLNKRILIINADGSKEELVLPQERKVRSTVQLAQGGQRVKIPNTALEITAGPEFHQLQLWLNIGTRSGILRAAIKFLYEVAKAEIAGSVVYAVDPTTNERTRLHAREAHQAS